MQDVSSACEFYRDVVGLTFLFSPSPQLAFLQAGAVRIMLTTPQGHGTVGANSVIYLSVENVQARFNDMVERGAIAERSPELAAQMPDHELWIGFVRDPEANLIGLLEEVR